MIDPATTFVQLPMSYELLVTVISMAVNVIMALGGLFASWFMQGLKSSLSDLKKKNDHLETSINSLNLLVAGKNVTRDEMEQRLEKLSNAIFAKLDRIEDALSRKEDRDKN